MEAAIKHVRGRATNLLCSWEQPHKWELVTGFTQCRAVYRIVEPWSVCNNDRPYGDLDTVKRRHLRNAWNGKVLNDSNILCMGDDVRWFRTTPMWLADFVYRVG